MLKAQVEGFKCVRRRRGRPGDAKATGNSKYQLGIMHTRANGSYCGLRNPFAWRKTMIYNLRHCCLKLFVYGWLIPMLISWVLRDLSEISRRSWGWKQREGHNFLRLRKGRGHEKWAVKRARVMQMYALDLIEVHPQKKKEVLYLVKKKKKNWEK